MTRRQLKFIRPKGIPLGLFIKWTLLVWWVLLRLWLNAEIDVKISLRPLAIYFRRR